jgi:uncharacterized protein YbaP (TraB family)
MRWLPGLLALLIAAPALAAPGMWVVRDNDTEITLFGTIHALPKGTLVLGPAAKARFDAADTLVLEAIIPDDKFALAALVNELGTRPGLKPLLTRIGAKAAPGLADAAVRLNMPLEQLDRMETWLAAIALSEASLSAVGISAADGVEPALMVRAKTEGKAIVGLESVEQQLRYFNALPEADQLKMLEATVEDTKTARVDTDRLVALWQSGDMEAIASDFAGEAKASPLLTKVLLTNRNRRWADWITGVMKRPGKIFMAVGAGHFGGPEGLLALLAARGLPATRLLQPGETVPSALAPVIVGAHGRPVATLAAVPAVTAKHEAAKPVGKAAAKKVAEKKADGKKSGAKPAEKAAAKKHETKRKPKK